MTSIDLLYPGEEYRNFNLSEFSFIEELNLYDILGLNKNSFDLRQYFTKSKETIKYRNDILSDFVKNGCLAELEEIIKLIGAIIEARESKKQVSELISVLYSAFEIENYIILIEYLNKFLNRHKFSSAALADLKAYSEKISGSEEYINLKKNLKSFRQKQY